MKSFVLHGRNQQTKTLAYDYTLTYGHALILREVSPLLLCVMLVMRVVKRSFLES